VLVVVYDVVAMPELVVTNVSVVPNPVLVEVTTLVVSMTV